MNFAFFLKEPKSEGKTPLMLIVSQGNRKYKKYIGISVIPSQFRKQRTKDEAVNSVLKKIEAILNERLDQFSTEKDIRSAIADAVALNDSPKKERGVPFWEYFRQWSEREMPSKRFRSLAMRRIADIMGTEDDWNDIDGNYFFLLESRLDARGYSHNYKATLMTKLRTVLKEGYDRGISRNESFRDIRRRWVTADTVALTMEEVDRLWNLDLPSSEERKARDLFMVGVYTAARFQNYSRLSLDNISDGKIRFVQPKTGGSVVIPCSPRISEILGRWGGSVPQLSNVNLNLNIKEVCRKAGIDTPVEIRKVRGGKTVVETHPKYELVSTHTARRTGASLLYLDFGVPAKQCMMLTGHTTESNFFKYIKISKEQNAEKLADNPFFK